MSEEIEKCTKPYIADLPYDLRTTDLDKLKERADTIESNIKERENQIKDLTKLQGKQERELLRAMSRSKDSLSQLENMFKKDLNLDEDETFIDSSLNMGVSGYYINERYKDCKKLLKKALKEYKDIENQYSEFANGRAVLDEKVLEPYSKTIKELKGEMLYLTGLGHTINADSSYTVNDDFYSDCENLIDEMPNIQQAYVETKDYQNQIDAEQKIVDDLYEEGVRTNERANAIGGK